MRYAYYCYDGYNQKDKNIVSVSNMWKNLDHHAIVLRM